MAEATALANGSRIGPYEIVAPLGAGAMGEVYRARDPRLGRDIAIKVLHEEASGLADRRARFEREARAAAALNHPNILSVYDFGLENGRFYTASELIEGESLRDRIRRGQIPVRELYRIAVQLADGMAAAHAAGITHRDLKPENVMLTTDGRVKILDFGLARQAPAPRGSTAAAASPDATLTQVDTQPGTVLGTVGYMSPEQVRGLPLDYRSDQFSFGTILYEMATGTRPFASETSVQTMSAILTEQPKPIDAKIPPPLRWTIARCLEKDAAARYESSRDLYHELRGQQEHLSDVFTSSEAPAVAVPPTAARSWWPKTAIVVAWWAFHRTPGIARYRFTPMEVSWANPGNPVWSPDGKAFAYDAEVNGIREVFLRYLNSPTPVQLTRARGSVTAVGWSADSKRVFSWDGNPTSEKPPNAIFSTPVFGGEPDVLLTADITDAAASADGKALAAIVSEDDKRVVKTSIPIGAPFQRYSPAPFETKEQFNQPSLQFSPNGKRILLFIDQSQGRLVWNLPWPAGHAPPQRVPLDLPLYGQTPRFTWLPDSRHVILSLQDKADDEHRHLWIADVDSGAWRQITSGTSSEFEPALSPDRKQLLFRDWTFMSPDGKAKQTIGSFDAVEMTFSKDSHRLYGIREENGRAHLFSLDLATRQQKDIGDLAKDFVPSSYLSPGMRLSLSPDGKSILYPVYRTSSSRWMLEGFE
jgi:eukaryotic-like serine/threonine-protein kinase